LFLKKYFKSNKWKGAYGETFDPENPNEGWAATHQFVVVYRDEYGDHYTTVGKSLEPQTWGTSPTTVLETNAGTNDKIAWPANFTWPALKKGEWVSVEIPISAYANAGLDLSKTTSMRFVAGNGTVYIDNLYAYGDPDGTIIPEDDEVDIPAAPTPIHLQADVVSAFGDYYTLNTKGWTPQNWSAVGDNSFDIVVTAESGNTRTYTLSVFRNYPAGIEKVASSTVVSGANGVISAVFDGKANVKLYSITGQLIHQSFASRNYSQTVDKGIYILSIDEKTYKIVVR
jgi:hypothetical protein